MAEYRLTNGLLRVGGPARAERRAQRGVVLVRRLADRPRQQPISKREAGLHREASDKGGAVLLLRGVEAGAAGHRDEQRGGVLREHNRAAEGAGGVLS